MERTIEENNISAKRLRYVIAIIISCFATTVFLCYRFALLLDAFLCLMTLNLIFLLVFLLALMKYRLLGRLPQKQSASYQKIFFLMLICCGCVCIASYFPDYFAPVMLMGVFLTTAMEPVMALAASLYYVLLLGMAGGCSIYVMVCYSILCVVGVLLATFLSDKTRVESIAIYLIYFLCGHTIPLIFYYMGYHKISSRNFVLALAAGMITCAAIMIFYPMLERICRQELAHSYRKFLDDSYPLVSDIRRFSMAEYNHAKRVSRLALACADEIGVNGDCAAMAGFYYRLGKMEGEPEIDNALRLANNHCFPTDVMAVMEEYGGVLRLPQTPESAIVHMVDTLVTKIEVLDQATMSSTWNQDMVIYQTLNELSQKGFYDESGLSINQFLKIREKLVQEDSLL